ncbi:MAG TPA: PEP-CTERM sorting domain-containing protein [Roseiarcus sp.]
MTTWTKVGSDVVATGSGSLNLTSLLRSPTASDAFPSVNGALGDEFTGDPDFTYPYYGAVGPAVFGTATNTLASSSSGHLAGVITNGDSSFVVIYIEEGYVSGDALDGVATYDHQTLASLGLTPGVYAYTWGAGLDADSFTVRIGDIGSLTPAPEPPTWVMMLAGFGGLCAAGARASPRSESRRTSTRAPLEWDDFRRRIDERCSAISRHLTIWSKL